MLKTFTALSPFIKFRSKNISIDNLAFKFHYRATYLILLVCTLLVTSRQYIGDHIKCITDNAIPSHVINSFCFFTPTFTVVRHYNETMLAGGWLPHPGIGDIGPREKLKHHAYYQWVPFFLFAQAIFFFLPHFLWRLWEGGRIKALVEGLQMISLSKHNQKKSEMRFSGNYVLPSNDMIKGRISLIKDDFYKHIRVNKRFARCLIFCELLNLINLIVQIYVTNVFLAGQFYSLGFNFMEDDFTGPMDVLDTVFPKVTKCDFYKYGASGSLQRHDALCVMALNIIHEKIYVILWFWYWIMLVVSLGSIVWRLTTMLMYSRSMWFNRVLFSSTCPGRLNTKHLATVVRHISYSDWLFLYYLATNMEAFVFCDLLADLAAEFRQQYVDEQEVLNNERETVRVDEIGEKSTPEKESIDEVDLRRKPRS
ncbi:innexin inx7 [Contarinia nasturtii]|uniref:innexin inx7 n=1 Tax=Contarinia nasturtii TaxID=265458 RepID=UPI0012D46DCC|nr:innexin inx7 [Contarinia nasturtii]